MFRFGNGIFEPIWNRRYIDHVQITVAETVGVERRGGYYDKSGALRDMVPNHIFQLLTLTAMEPPISFEADAVRDEQAKVLRAMQPSTPEEVLRRTVRGQYGPGVVERQAASRRIARSRTSTPHSHTETFVALKLYIDNWRWADVPFYLRTGKRLPKRADDDRDPVQAAAVHAVPRHAGRAARAEPARAPHPARRRHLAAASARRCPGPQLRLGNVDMEFNYADYFGDRAEHRLRDGCSTTA